MFAAYRRNSPCNPLLTYLSTIYLTSDDARFSLQEKQPGVLFHADNSPNSFCRRRKCSHNSSIFLPASFTCWLLHLDVHIIARLKLEFVLVVGSSITHFSVRSPEWIRDLKNASNQVVTMELTALKQSCGVFIYFIAAGCASFLHEDISILLRHHHDHLISLLWQAFVLAVSRTAATAATPASNLSLSLRLN